MAVVLCGCVVSLFHFLHECREAPDLNVFSPLKAARDIARAMQYLQNRAKPVLYRDLKSKNVLIDEHFNVKLAYPTPPAPPRPCPLLPAACCLLPAACCLLPAACQR